MIRSVPQQLNDEEWAKLLTEQDPFKLAIRGFAAIEADIAEAMKDAFPGKVPQEIRSTGFTTRLALAVGLGIVPEQYQGGFKTLAKLRNDFAHDEIHDLTAQRAKALVGAWPSNIFPKPVRDALAEARPRLTLSTVLVAARGAIRVAARAREEERERRARAFQQSAIAEALRSRIETVAGDEPPVDDAND